MDDLERKERADQIEGLVSEASEEVAQREAAALDARTQPHPGRKRLPSSPP